MLQTPGVAARIGADDLDFFASPRPDLLREISGVEPVTAGTHVLLEEYGVQSTQRLGLGVEGGQLVAALWPAELKAQAIYLYGERVATAMITAARAQGWTAEPSPQIAFRNSHPSQRLYMSPQIDAADYAQRWQDGDLKHIGQYQRSEVRTRLWRWLKSRDYATDSDDQILDEFLAERLGKRPAYLRPGLRLKRRFELGALRTAARHCGTAAEIRRDLDAILTAAREPALPARRHTAGTKQVR